MPAPTRRGFLMGAALSGIGWLGGRTALADVAVNTERREGPGDVFVFVFMRGGADGLNLVAPYFEDGYHRARPALALKSPRATGTGARALDLDGRFGTHPALAPLHALFHEGRLGIVHACGSGDQSRSHFEAMSAMERGLPQQDTGVASGWIARHLATTQGNSKSPLRAVAFSSVMPDSLRGATDATALNSLADFRITMPDGAGDSDFREALKDLYGTGKDAVAEAGRETLAVLDTLNRIDPARYAPANGAAYPQGDFGKGLKQVACLIKGEVGLEVVCLDHRGPYLWDTHVVQDTVFSAQAGDLANGIAAFVRDLGSEMNRVTLVAMTEFGRRLHENTGLGTDHGRGGVLLVTGGGTVGGKVHGAWPGLEEKDLEGPGDLRVVNDYRNLLAEIVQKRLHNDRLSEVFPDLRPAPMGVVHS